MDKNRPIRIFTAHSWREDENYLRVFDYLESARDFRYVNTSRPLHNVAQMDERGANVEMRYQIDAAEIVIIPAGLYAQDAGMASFIAQHAVAAGKPVLVMTQFGTGGRIPQVLGNAANQVIGWDERSMVDAVRRLARGEDSSRNDVIEFSLD